MTVGNSQDYFLIWIQETETFANAKRFLGKQSDLDDWQFTVLEKGNLPQQKQGSKSIVLIPLHAGPYTQVAHILS